jgi:hypothetical protein
MGPVQAARYSLGISHTQDLSMNYCMQWLHAVTLQALLQGGNHLDSLLEVV